MLTSKLTRRSALATGICAAFGGTWMATAAQANAIAFDSDWQHLTFRRLAPNQFETAQSRLTVIADGSSSILYKILPDDLRGATRAAWSWQVESSVPPSDLSQIGNDDRNLGMFFVSMSAAAAARVGPNTSIRSLLTNRSAQVLMYTWGGGLPPGSVVPSPHAPERLRNLITRPAQTGRFSEAVNLQQDFPRVFGAPLERLVAVAVSSNSENTPARVVAHITDLRVT